MQRILKYGLLGGLGASVYVTVEFFIGLHGPYLSVGRYVGYLLYVAVAVGIYLAIKQAKEVTEGAPLTFWKAVGIGTGVAAIAGIVLSVYNWFYMIAINPNFLQDYTNFMLDQMHAEGSTSEQIAEFMQMVETYRSPVFQFMFFFGETIVIGFVFSLIAGALLRTKQPAGTSA
ncbi:MAG: DUF4199 domain-containing protein [Nitrososphaera sp.]|nr:DUF4199 domain-containing protein [Nitrososphaera sp.]MCI0706728.1 DUF4199 domain-containing protein [Ignavibacteriota bacterium]